MPFIQTTGSLDWSYLTTTTVNYSYPTTTTAPTQTSTPPAPVPADSVSTVTGIDPNEVAAATFGKLIPIWVGGMPRLGCHIIYGPTVILSSGIPIASFGVSFGMPANNLGTRELRELRLDGYKVWSLAEGSLLSGLTFRFYGGTETQATDPLVSAAYPSAPVAHKGQCCVFIENLPLTDFSNKVPFVSALIADITDGVDPTNGVNLGDALQQIASSPYVNLDFAAVDISERVDAVIVAEKMSFIDLVVRYSRLYLWDVVQRDKLKVIERGTVVPDLTLDLTQILAVGDEAPILIDRQQQAEVPRELEYSYIDIDRDYEINQVVAFRQSAPVPVTVSAGRDTIALPSVHTVQEAISWATLRQYKDELARDRVSFTTSIYGYEIEPGDIVALDAGFKNYVLRIIETLHGANWTNRCIAEPVLRCAVPVSSAPLDGIACVTAAWSMSRQLLSVYSADFYTELSGAVRRIADQSGNARHFDDLGGSATRPAVATGGPLNRACADFDGSNDYLDTGLDLSAFITNSAAYVIISVIVDAVTLDDVDPQDNHCLIGDAAQQFGIYARNLSGLTLYGVNNDGSVDSVSKTKTLATPLVVSLRHEGGTLYIRTNTGLDTSTTSGNTASLTGDLRLGMSASGLNANVKVFEIVTFNCVPNEGTRDALEHNFLAWIGGTIEPPAGDPLFSLVALLIGPIGADGSTTITDESPSAHGNATVSGNAQIDTGIVKFEASAQFDGTGDQLEFADSDDWDLDGSNGQFTIEAFVRFSSLTGNQTICAQRLSGTPVAFQFYKHSTNVIQFVGSTNSTTFDITPFTSTTVSVDTWHHVAMDKDATGKYRVYIDGVMGGSQTPANGNLANIASPLTIGGWGGNQDMINGRIEELRITKNVARYATDGSFTVPVARFPRE